jgi:zinc-ribbon domain
MKPISGQYECVHTPGVGLDYFTSRIDKLTLYSDGRFVLIIQPNSRVTHAAKTFLKGEQVTATAPETRQEGTYTHQGQDTHLELFFANGGQEQGQLSWDGAGLQLGPNFFNKVSDSTLIPPTQRIKKDMNDIAKGLKIASTFGGFAMKAAKTVQGAIQPDKESTHLQPDPQSTVNTQTQTPPSTRFCEQCGTRIQPGKRFCNHCGAPLQ